MTGVQKLMIGGKAIFSMDYSTANENEIIAIGAELTELGLVENKRLLIMAIYNEKNFVTPRVMRQLERLTSRVIHLIDKAALVGLSPTKKVILRGSNLIFKRDFKAFDTREEAVAYLLDENIL